MSQKKFLSKEQILISIDRLTRFKNPKVKYYRVFYDIILSGTSDLKYKKADLERFSPKYITELAQDILNHSIYKICNIKNAPNLNIILKDYENSIFVCDEETNILLDNKIDYVTVCDFIDETSPINLKWLKSLILNTNMKKNREINFLKYPIEKVILVEGLTEEILLPAFSKIIGYDFYQQGIQLIPAGGKNQVVKLYYELAEELKIPIFVLLDKDAEENILQIIPRLRKIDKIHLISCGEFEDLLPKSLIIKTINNDLNNFATISEFDFTENVPETKNLENIFKQKGLHEFKKADFAKLVKSNIDKTCEITEEIKNIIDEIKYF